MNKLLRTILGALVIITFLISEISSASLGDICTSDADCDSIVNSICNRMYDCINGTCACRSGYGNSNNNGCQKRLRSYGQSCGSGDFCSGANQQCISGKCKCATWYDYSSLARECTLQTYRLLSQVCGTWWNYECLQTIEDTGGQCASDRCSCRDGYIADYTESFTTCRAPRWGERCLSIPSCTEKFDSSTISDDTSSIAPTCRNNICTCPPSHEHHVVNGYNLCLNKVNDGFERYENNETCTHFNECKSYLCVKCPGATTGLCMAQSGAVSVHLGRLVTWRDSVLIFFLFLLATVTGLQNIV